MLDLFAETDPQISQIAGQNSGGLMDHPGKASSLATENVKTIDIAIGQVRRDFDEKIDDIDSRYLAFIERKYIWMHECGRRVEGIGADICDLFFHEFELSRIRLNLLRHQMHSLRDDLKEINRQKARLSERRHDLTVLLSGLVGYSDVIYEDFFIAAQDFYCAYAFGCAFASEVFWKKNGTNLKALPYPVQERFRALDELAASRRWHKHETGHIALLYREMEILLDRSLERTDEPTDGAIEFDRCIDAIVARFRLGQMQKTER